MKAGDKVVVRGARGAIVVGTVVRTWTSENLVRYATIEIRGQRHLYRASEVLESRAA